ncbi:MAG TPA: spermidine/putrescine ABC transporter substrate-binding protein [Desulfomonilia bacterium]|jgi:spermidine/putrescine transport system substrate-binding protein|nr:spermidine/putrescine ABC transporter substrate-binding protein [Thermodesulfobacteriota bacterium]HWR69180.1 spermidine/putrescine ABC transporter substrate-binding protein [Desulfomonilia bacterium]
MRRLLVVLVLVLLPVLAFGAKQEVYVFNWTEYIDPGVIKQFEQETGIKVRYSTYDSNEAMFAKLKLVKKAGYDVAFPSTYYVERMRKLNLIQPLDKAKIPNMKHINPSLLNKPYDPGNAYSIPYMWGSSAIGVNSKYVDPKGITSWNDLWNPKYKGKVLLMDDVREVFAMSLRSMGYSGNTTDSAQIRKAYEKLLKLRPNVKVFNSDSPRQPFLNNEVVIGQIWGGEVYQANQENRDIKLIYPKEGAIFWADNMVIPGSARNVGLAYKFIDFLCRPEVAKKNCEYIGYATTNLKAQQMLDARTKNHKAVYPDDAEMKRGEFQSDVGEAIMTYEKYWEMLKTQ